MCFEGKIDKTEKYNLWKQRIEIYSQITGKKAEHLVLYILEGLDNEGLKIYHVFNLTNAQRLSPRCIFDKFVERLKISKPNL